MFGVIKRNKTFLELLRKPFVDYDVFWLSDDTADAIEITWRMKVFLYREDEKTRKPRIVKGDLTIKIWFEKGRVEFIIFEVYHKESLVSKLEIWYYRDGNIKVEAFNSNSCWVFTLARNKSVLFRLMFAVLSVTKKHRCRIIYRACRAR